MTCRIQEMKFRKKPIVVEAVQFSAINFAHPAVVWEPYPHIKTPEGNYRVSDGDWIITGVRGEHYPCKPEIFELTYERVE